jgi:aminoglycoside/choline kinase family phosphotransferase
MIKLISEILNEEVSEILPLSGDASSRKYSLIRANNDYLLCEDSLGDQSRNFVKMTEKLKGKIATPKIIANKIDEGYLIQEYVGAKSLNSFVSTASVPDTNKKYQCAIDDIFQYYELGSEDVCDRSFDDEKLNFEFDLANKFFIEEYLGSKIDEDIITEAKSFINAKFKEIKYQGCHRDYHGRNLLMGEGEKLVHIDYQDARLGPYVYDLVSLLEDSYLDTGEILKEKFKNYFFKNLPLQITRERFEYDYKLCKVQRQFKVLGSFAYLKIDKQKPGYERYIGYTFDSLRKTMMEVPELRAFLTQLCESYYDA